MSTTSLSLSLTPYVPPTAPSRRSYATIAERMRSAMTAVHRHEQRRGYVLAAVAGHLGTDPDGMWGAEVMTSALTDQGDGSVTLVLEHLELGEATPGPRQRLTYLLLRAEAALIGQRPGAGYESTARTLALSGVVPQARAASGRAWDAAITAAIQDECGQSADIGPDDWSLFADYIDAARNYVTGSVGRLYISGTADPIDARGLAMTCFGISHMLRAVIASAEPDDADIECISDALVNTLDWCSRVHQLLSPGSIPGDLMARGYARWIRALADAIGDRQGMAYPIPSSIVVAGMLADHSDCDRSIEHVDMSLPEYRWVRPDGLRPDDTVERVYCFLHSSSEQLLALLECGWISATAEMIQRSLDVRGACRAAKQIERAERDRLAAIEEERIAAQVAAHPMTALATRIAELAALIEVHPLACGTHTERLAADAFYSARYTCRERLGYQVHCHLLGRVGLDGMAPSDTIDGAIDDLRLGLGGQLVESSAAHTEFVRSADELRTTLSELRAMLDSTQPLVAPAISCGDRG